MRMTTREEGRRAAASSYNTNTQGLAGRPTTTTTIKSLLYDEDDHDDGRHRRRGSSSEPPPASATPAPVFATARPLGDRDGRGRRDPRLGARSLTIRLRVQLPGRPNAAARREADRWWSYDTTGRAEIPSPLTARPSSSLKVSRFAIRLRNCDEDTVSHNLTPCA